MSEALGVLFFIALTFFFVIPCACWWMGGKVGCNCFFCVRTWRAADGDSKDRSRAGSGS